MSDKSDGKEPSKNRQREVAVAKRQKVANFIKNYGRSRFRELLSNLAEGKSGRLIADEFGVSRERVRQWKNTFGDMVTIYQLHPEIEKILNDRGLDKPR